MGSYALCLFNLDTEKMSHLSLCCATSALRDSSNVVIYWYWCLRKSEKKKEKIFSKILTAPACLYERRAGAIESFSLFKIMIAKPSRGRLAHSHKHSLTLRQPPIDTPHDLTLMHNWEKKRELGEDEIFAFRLLQSFPRCQEELRRWREWLHRLPKVAVTSRWGQWVGVETTTLMETTSAVGFLLFFFLLSYLLILPSSLN